MESIPSPDITKVLKFNLNNDRQYSVKNRSNQISGTCSYPWTTMVILHDGKVVTCCLDYNGVQVVGDVNKDTI